jgi:hypothetical protein
MPRASTLREADIPKHRRKWCKNAAGVAVDHGVTRQAVVQWQQQGAPSYLMDDGSRLYDGGELFWWRLERATGKTKAQVLAEDERRAALLKSGHCPNCAVKLAAR